MSDGVLEPSGSAPTTGEARTHGPVVVVTAVSLSPAARAALAESLGPGHIVRDIREAGNSADVVLVPSMSGHGIGELRSMFPGAKILAGEFLDDRYGINIDGPVRRAVESGVDGYFLAPDLAGVAQVTRDAALGRPIGVLGAGNPDTRARLEAGTSTPGRGTLHLVDPREVRQTADELRAVAVDTGEWAERLALESSDQRRQLDQLLSSVVEQLLSRGVDVVCPRPADSPAPPSGSH